MTRPRHALPAALLLWAAATTWGQVHAPEQIRDGMAARLGWRVADQPVGPGLAAATFTLTVTGPVTLEAAPAQLGDATASWQATSTFFCQLQDERLTLTEQIALKQTKPGQAALPSVKVRFRAERSSPWQEAEWTELSKPRGDLVPEVTPALPAWSPPRWFWPAVVGAGALPVLLLGAWWLTRPPRSKKQTPAQWALRELAGLEASIGQQGSAWYHTRLSYIVRRFLAERYGLPAAQQTTAEFLATSGQNPSLSGDQRELLRQLLERCDLAKFAPVNVSTEECRTTAGLARRLVDSAGGAV